MSTMNYRADRALSRWCDLNHLFVEDARFLGSTLSMARKYGVKNVTASVAMRRNEGYAITIQWTVGGKHARGNSGPWKGLAAVCLGDRSEAWHVAGRLAYLLENIGLVADVRRARIAVANLQSGRGCKRCGASTSAPTRFCSSACTTLHEAGIAP